MMMIVIVMFYLYMTTKLMLMITDRIQMNNKYLHRLLNMMEKAKAVTDEWILMTLYIQGRHAAEVS